MDVKRLRQKENNDKDEEHVLKLQEEAAVKILHDQIFNENSLVADVIFGFVPMKDILSFLLVYKNWNSVTSNYLWRKRQCFLSIDLTNENGLQPQLQPLQDQMFYYNHYQGLIMKLIHEDCSESSACKRKSDASQDLIIFHSGTITNAALNTKNVIITFEGSDKKHYCQFDYLRIVNRIFSILPQEAIEKLRITGFKRNFWTSMFTNVQDGGFALLTSIQASYQSRYYAPFRLAAEHYEAILRCCPFLTDLNMMVEYIACSIFARFNKLSLIKQLLIFTKGLNLTFGDENYRAIESMGDSLKYLFVGTNNYTKYDFAFFARILHLNSHSLREFGMHLNTVNDISLLTTQFPTLSNVLKFTIRSTFEEKSWQNYDVETLRDNPHLQSLFPKASIILSTMDYCYTRFDPVP